MKRLGTLVMAILLITGCNAMKPSMEEAELLWRETEKNIQKWVCTVEDEVSPTGTLQTIPELTVEIPQKTPVTATGAASEPQEAPTPEPDKSGQEGPCQPEQATPRQEDTPGIIDWPLITCPPEPERPQITAPEPPAATPWPLITSPEPPTYTPEPEPTEPPQEEPAPTPVPNAPVDPTPEPTEQPTDPTPKPPIEQPSTGYAECSCGARLTPDELAPHMKAHALNGENHSYRAY